MHPTTLEVLGRARQRELLQEASERRMAKQAREGQPGLRDRLREGLGARLIEAGERLKQGRGSQETATLEWAESYD